MKKCESEVVSMSLWGLAAMLFLGGAAGGPSGASQPVRAPFREGEFFPVRAFPSLKDGRPMSIADFRGKKVILHIFASW